MMVSTQETELAIPLLRRSLMVPEAEKSSTTSLPLVIGFFFVDADVDVDNDVDIQSSKN